jgi:hypothetical protein
LVGQYFYFPQEEMHVKPSFEEPGKHIVSITFVTADGTARWHKRAASTRIDEDPVLDGITEVTLDQETIDKIEIASETTENGRHAKSGGCHFFVLAEIFS